MARACTLTFVVESRRGSDGQWGGFQQWAALNATPALIDLIAVA
jgi:hypothetical protein